ncbi:MAG TPA: glycogen-binding domain-containing protein [Gemmatimonadaceae bacterium]|nr:glycogen-binding domain-containing protein [Gemmatimonadaceae bacterium]
MVERRIDPGPVVERAIESLRALPPVESASVSRVVTAAARIRALDAAPDADDLLSEPVAPRPRFALRISIAAAASVILAGGTVAALRAMHSSSQPARIAAAAPEPTASAVPASRDVSGEGVAIPTQFVFDGQARRVTLVGDFNNWDAHATPLEREPRSTLWSVTVPIQRGRHVYAFLVDSVWTIDKRAPVARDPDFGVTGSVILVGRP